MYRSRKDILLKMLQTLEKGDCRKTKIVYGTAVNFQKAQEYLDYLVRKGYVKYDSDRYYSITPMGKHACQVLHAAELIWQ